MIQPLTNRQVAGYPPRPFCGTHDRFVFPVTLTHGDGTKRQLCPYCADESSDMIFAPEAETTVKETKGWTDRGGVYYPRGVSVTYFCPHSKCQFQTNSHTDLDFHEDFVHGKMQPTCLVHACNEAAADFCVTCERVFCKNHLDHEGKCISCMSFMNGGFFV